MELVNAMNALSLETDIISDIWKDLDSFKTTDACDETHNLCICGDAKIVGHDGLFVCTGCGLVEIAHIDDSPEWVNGVGEDGKATDASRCGMAADTELFSEQWGTSTMIGGGKSYAAKRMTKLHFHMSMNHKDRSLYHAYASMERIMDEKLHLPGNVIHNAKVAYRKFQNDKLTRGAVRNGVKANCVFNACKEHRIARTTKEIADAFDIPTKDLSRTAHMFRDTVETKKSDILRPADVLSRLVQKFDLTTDASTEIINDGMEICDKLKKCTALMGKNPTSIASSIIYILLDEMATKQEICDTCEVSMPTLNKVCQIVKKNLAK